MNSRTLIVLATVTLLALGLAWALQRTPVADSAAAGQRLLPGFAEELNLVTALVIEPAGSNPFRLERIADGWRAPDKGGYPVDAGAVRRFVVRLAEAQVVETKTSNPELHGQLGVEVVDGRPGSGVRVLLEGAGHAPLLVIGQRETRGLAGTYVRRAGEATALLVDQDLQPAREPLDWLEREVLDTPPEQVVSLEIVHADGETVRIDRDELGIFHIANLPAGREPSGPTAAEATVRVLSDLRLDDVRPLATEDAEPPASHATFVLQNGVTLEARSWRSASDGGVTDHWVAFAAHAMAGADVETAAAAREVNDRLGSWTFRLPAWKHEQLNRRLEDLLRPIAP